MLSMEREPELQRSWRAGICTSRTFWVASSIVLPLWGRRKGRAEGEGRGKGRGGGGGKGVGEGGGSTRDYESTAQL